ncbi:hypothetical protein SAMN04487949_0837 [Halogranum gelatinilyticum]|uniref:Uncharacterized protein n=1 Tax=Halogranum gelatinilyticum TaxID=660521 RepID=A0A1G9QFM6_9EURY|nr:hypothetical protein [Halogranum gelatinilyticum]SDM09766.1 hypothetical protein SAMN04487949_0837 [Halogranum gelatinilyticum]
MVPSPFDADRALDATDLVAGVGLALCLAFGSAALADAALDTTFWPDGAEYGVGLIGFVTFYVEFLRRLGRRERAVSVGLLVFSTAAMVVAAYTNPEGVLTTLALFAFLAAVAYGGGHAVKTLGTSKDVRAGGS